MQIGFRISQQRVCTGMEKNTIVLRASLHLFPFSENYVFYVVILFSTEKTNVFADFDAVTCVVCKIVCIHLWYLILSLCKVTAFFRVRQTNQTNFFQSRDRPGFRPCTAHGRDGVLVKKCNIQKRYNHSKKISGQ
jgi:hypothetical protein